MTSRPPGIQPYGHTPKQLVLSNPARILAPAPQSNERNEGIDLRKEFNDFIEPNGHMILLQRMNLQIHCTQCWNELNGEGDPQCPYCLGRGYLSVLERHISRRMSALNEHQLELVTQTSPGPEMVDELFWWFEWSVNPQEEDIIYEVSWADPEMVTPQRLLSAYRVRYAQPFRGDGGRIEFWRCTVSGRPIDAEIVGQHLRRITPQILRIEDDGVLRYAGTYRS